MDSKNRFKLIREHYGLSMGAFGKSIGLSASGVSAIEYGTRALSDKHIKLICASYSDVNEHWLRTGEGEPFNEPSDEDVLEDILREANASPAIRSFVAAWAQLDPQQQAVLEKFVADYVADYHQRAADAAASEAAHIATSRATPAEDAPPEALPASS